MTRDAGAPDRGDSLVDEALARCGPMRRRMRLSTRRVDSRAYRRAQQSSRVRWCNAASSSKLTFVSQAGLSSATSRWLCCSSEFSSVYPAERIRAMDSTER